MSMSIDSMDAMLSIDYRLENRIKKGIPQEGNVRLLCVTEKQYADMKLLVGSRQTAETAIGTERLIII